MQKIKMEDFPKTSRVWVYQADKEFHKNQLQIIDQRLDEFIKNWSAHQQSLTGTYQIRYNRFIILMVNECEFKASGCSVDASVHFLQKLGLELGIDFFNRFIFAFEEESKVVCLSKADFEKAIQTGRIRPETIVFNNLVRNAEELERLWRVPLKESWFGNYFAQPIAKTWA